MVEDSPSDLHISDEPSCFKPNLKYELSKSSGSVKVRKHTSGNITVNITMYQVLHM